MIKITIISGVIELKDDFSEDQLLKEYGGNSELVKN